MSDWEFECGCGLNGRCEKHLPMMQKIREVYDAAATAKARRIYLLSDGFGPGMDPSTTEWDWSGIRDSTPAAVEDMYAEAIR